MVHQDNDPRRPAAPIEEPLQPDPMLQTGRSPLRGWVVILAAVVVLCLVLYGLNAQRPPEQAASGAGSATTSNAPSSGAGTPAASPQTTTGQGQQSPQAAPQGAPGQGTQTAPAPAAPPPSGQSNSGNQGEGNAPTPNTR